MRTPCAFHPQQQITQFCKCEPCLLPLCPECMPIHLNEHCLSSSKEANILPIEAVCREISGIIQKQHQYVSTITVETMTKYRESDECHRKLVGDIVKQRDKLIQWVNNIYESILLELDSNAKRREAWISDFNESVLQLREELNSLEASLLGEKHLRVVIMWNKMKPNEAIEEITKKAQKKWLKPNFSGCKQEEIVEFISSHTNLSVLQIEGDSGVNKILQIIRVLRYGEPDFTPTLSTSSLEQKEVEITSSKDIFPVLPSLPIGHNIGLTPPIGPIGVNPVPYEQQNPQNPQNSQNCLPRSPRISFKASGLPSSINPPIIGHKSPQVVRQSQHSPNHMRPPIGPQKNTTQNPGSNLNIQHCLNSNALPNKGPLVLGSPRKISTKKIEVFSNMQIFRDRDQKEKEKQKEKQKQNGSHA